MQNQPYPSNLRNRQWDCIKDLILAAKPGGRPRRRALLQVLNAIRSVVVRGGQWRMLPKDYPAWQSVYHDCRQ